MNAEIILWIVLWVLVSEILFIALLRFAGPVNWISHKIVSFLLSGMMFFLHWGIVHPLDGSGVYYIRLVYELFGLLILVILFIINWALVKLLGRNR